MLVRWELKYRKKYYITVTITKEYAPIVNVQLQYLHLKTIITIFVSISWLTCYLL